MVRVGATDRTTTLVIDRAEALELIRSLAQSLQVPQLPKGSVAVKQYVDFTAEEHGRVLQIKLMEGT
jgi:hypothetical protein